jgi:nucleoside-diphosphate-sugar epimerase
VTGAGGFIGPHLVRELKARGLWVRGVDLHPPQFSESPADEFVLADLRDQGAADRAVGGCGADEVYALAADMGGMGYISFHDADILSRNLAISLNTLLAAYAHTVPKIVYASSACVYPDFRQLTVDAAPLAEAEAYPADPQDGYGWEKLTTERTLQAFHAAGRIGVRIARLHNIYGPEGTWDGGREKAPAAMCRKIARVPDGSEVQVWGDGQQTRSFCYIDDAVKGILMLAASDFSAPLNIGSSELVTIDDLALMTAQIAGKNIRIRHVPGPQGVRGRNSDNTLIRSVLGWEPGTRLQDGMLPTYQWVARQVAEFAEGAAP